MPQPATAATGDKLKAETADHRRGQNAFLSLAQHDSQAAAYNGCRSDVAAILHRQRSSRVANAPGERAGDCC